MTPRLPSLQLVIAHPDDEVVFFFHTLRHLAPRRLRLVCLTGRFGADTAVRRAELEASADALGAELACLDLEDVPRRPLDPAGVARIDRVLDDGPVLTHGPLGDYGHPHHMDAFLACARAGADTWCLAGPLEVHRAVLVDAVAAQRATLAERYPSQRRVHHWAGMPERLCHVPESADGVVLAALAQGRRVATDAFDRFERALSPEAAHVAACAPESGVRDLVSGCLARWRTFLPDAP